MHCKACLWFLQTSVNLFLINHVTSHCNALSSLFVISTNRCDSVPNQSCHVALLSLFVISTNRCDSVPGGEDCNDEVVGQADRSRANDEPGKSWTKIFFDFDFDFEWWLFYSHKKICIASAGCLSWNLVPVMLRDGIALNPLHGEWIRKSYPKVKSLIHSLGRGLNTHLRMEWTWLKKQFWREVITKS